MQTIVIAERISATVQEPPGRRDHIPRVITLFRLNLLQRLVRHGDIRLVGLMVVSRFSPRLSVVVFTRLR
jgi:hypothetical protein